MRDMAVKGRSQIGIAHHNAKLTDADVESIRSARMAGATLTTLASQHGVTFQTISKIVNGHRWTHIT